MVKYNFIISRVSQSRMIRNEAIANEERKNYSPASVNILNRSYVFYHALKFVLLLFLSFFLSTAFPSPRCAQPGTRPGVLFGVTFQPSIEQAAPRGRHPSLRPLDVFTMNPYLPGCQCDIYVTWYCVSERVIEIFLAFDSSRWVSLDRNDLALSTHTWNRFSTSVSATRNDPCTIPIVQPRFSTDKVSPLAKFIRAGGTSSVHDNHSPRGVSRDSEILFIRNIDTESSVISWIVYPLSFLHLINRN